MKRNNLAGWVRIPVAVVAVAGFAALGLNTVGLEPALSATPTLAGAPTTTNGSPNEFKGFPWATPPTSGCPSAPHGESTVTIPSGSGFPDSTTVTVAIGGVKATITGTAKTSGTGTITNLKFFVPCGLTVPALYTVTVTAGGQSASYNTTGITHPNELAVDDGSCPTTLQHPTGHTVKETLIYYSGRKSWTKPVTGVPFTWYFSDDAYIGKNGTIDPVVYINGVQATTTTQTPKFTRLSNTSGTAITGHSLVPIYPVDACGGSPGYKVSSGMTYNPPTNKMVFENETALSFTPKLTKPLNTIEIYQPDGDGDGDAYKWTTIVGPTPRLQVSKSATPTSRTDVSPTQTVTYTLTFSNTTGTAAAAVKYTDNLSDVTDDAGVVTTPHEASGSGLTVSAISDGKFTVSGTVPAGTTDTVSYSVKVDKAATDHSNHVLNNYLIPTGTTPPSSCLSTNPYCTTNPIPAITIKKTATPTIVTKAGQTVTYSFLVTSTGGTKLHTVTVTDKFTSPTTADVLVTAIKCVASTTSGTCPTTTTATLTPGQHALFKVMYRVTSTDLAQGVINNTSTASGETPTPSDQTKTNKVTSAPSTASVATADLMTAKASSPVSTTDVKPTQTVVYTLTFANTAGTAAAPVSYTDNLSDVIDDASVVAAPHETTGSGLTVGSISATKFTITGSVPAGTTDTVSYTVKVDKAATDHGNHVLTNYLIPTGTTTPSSCTNENPDCTTNPVPAITIKKTATPTSVTEGGQTVTYTFVVTNTGATDLHDVSVTDMFTSPTTTDVLSSSIECQSKVTPTGTCSGPSADLVPGQSATFSATYKVTSTDLAQGVINDSSTASGHTPTPHTSEVTITVTSAPSTASVGTADLVTAKVSSPLSTTNVKPTQVVTYTLTFSNMNGSVPAPAGYTDILTDVLDDSTIVTEPKETTGSGLTVSVVTKGMFTVIGTVPGGTTDTVTYSVKVNKAATDHGNHVLTNYLIPSNTTPPSSCKSTNSDCTTNPVPAITITKTATPTSVNVGQTVTYKFVVTNDGGTALKSVSVTDKFTTLPTDTLSSPIDCVSLVNPAGSCSGASVDLAIGQSATFAATYVATAADGAKGVIDNTSTASGNSTTPRSPTKTTKVISSPSTASVMAHSVTKATTTTKPVTTTTQPQTLAITGAPLAEEVGGGIVLLSAGLALILVDVRRRRRTP